MAMHQIGAGPIPVETPEGWLLIYHGVLHSCNGYVYSFGSALLDLDEPWKVKFRSGPYLLARANRTNVWAMFLMYVSRVPLCTTMKRAGLPYTMAVPIP